MEAQRHHRVTRWFLDPGCPGSLRPDVDGMLDDGSGMSAVLQSAVDSLAWVPMDDSICEGPHARAKRIKMPASAARWTWVAASMRLQQNLKDCESQPEEVGTSFRSAWTSYASVVQPAHKENKFPRMKASELERRLYRLEHLSSFEIGRPGEVPIAFQDVDVDDGIGGGGGHVGGVADALAEPGAIPLENAQGEADGEDGRRDDDAGAGAGAGPLVVAEVPAARARDRAERRAEDITFLRQFFAAILQRMEYFTVPVVGETGEVAVQAFQLLDLERKNIIVRPFVSLDDEAELSGLFTVTAQPLELWGGGDQNVQGDLLQTLNAFVLQEPSKIDIITACGAQLRCRHDIYLWQVRLSDVEGCVELFRPQRLSDLQSDLMSTQTPVLSLIDALERGGFAGVHEAVDHKAATRMFDARRLCGRRAYLQCALHMEKLLAKGICEFSSIGSQAYFDALLRGRGPVQRGLPAKAYRRMLAAESNPDLDLALMDVANRRPPQRPALPPVPADGPQKHGSESDGSVAGGDSGSDGPEHGDAAASGEDAAPLGVDAPHGARFPEGVPESILGVRVSRVRGRQTASHTYCDRLSVRCANQDHPGCRKSRSCALLRDRLGPRCAEAFLGVWLARAHDMAVADHVRYVPDVDAMQQWLTENP